MALTLEALQNKVEKMEATEGSKDWPNATFLPEGKHKVRFITDPKDELFLEYYSHGYFANGIRCPRSLKKEELPEGFNPESHELGELANKLKDFRNFKYGAKRNFLVYVYLYETNAPSDNWKPNNLYCLVGDRHLAKSYKAFIQSLAADAPEALLSSLDPSQEALLLSVEYVHGRDGMCSIAPTFPTKTVAPIDVSKFGYASLEQSYIKPGFNQDKYNALVERAKKDLVSLEASRAAKASLKDSEQPPETEAPEAMAKVGASKTGEETKETTEEPTTEETQPVVKDEETPPWDGEKESEVKQAKEQSAPAAETKPEGTVDTSNPWAKYQSKAQE